MHRLAVIVCSTRPGRVGPTVASWFASQAASVFDVDWVDLADIDLPLMDEPNHPRLQHYTQEHTRQFSARIEAADAVTFVSPEYNFFAPPALVNAVDYLHKEWRYLPCGLLTYGGVSGGLRAAQTIKQLVTSLRMFPIPEQIMVPMVGQHIKDGVFVPTEPVTASCASMLAELDKLAGALAPLRRA